jgi:phosphomevalonate kinase
MELTMEGACSSKGKTLTLVCPICEHCNEDDWHVLMDCHDSILARQIAGIDGIITARSQQNSPVKDIITNICRYEYRDVVGKFARVL